MSARLKVPSTLFRSATFDRATVNAEDRTVELAFSSETPVERYFGFEILDHGPDAVQLDRINSAGPLLFNHDRNAHIGRVERAWVEGRQGRAKVRFSNSPLGEEKFRDARDGILTEVSVGYRLLEVVLEKTEGEIRTYRATSWEPGEISLVTMPADTSVGIGRAADGEPETVNIPISGIRNMNTPAPAAPAATPTPAVVVNENDVRAAERARAKSLRTAGEQLISRGFDRDAIGALVIRATDEGMSEDAFNREALALVSNRPATPPPQQGRAIVGLTGRDVQRYSLLRAIRLAAEGRALDGLEAECSQELARTLGRAPAGFFVPDEVLFGRAVTGQSAVNGPDGGFTVGNTLLMSEFVEYLRNATKVVGLGARVISGLQGDVTIPRQLTGATAYWVGEGGQITGSKATFGQILGKPKRVGTCVPYTKQFLAQTSLSAEAFVREDSLNAIAVDLDRVAINGAGAAEPIGILNMLAAEVNEVTFGAAPTWEKYTEFWSKIATANALLGNPAYLGSVNAMAAAMTTPKVSGTAEFIMKDGKIGMYRADYSNQFPSGDKVVLGDWAQCLFLEWAGYDVVVDPYSRKNFGEVEVTIQRLMDVIFRRTKSFARSTDSGAQ